jgi:hypothetical protein
MNSMKNLIIKDIFTEDQIRHIYKVINETPDEKTQVQTRLGHKAYLVGLGEDVRAHIEKIVQEHYGDEWILNDYQFARYSKKFGYEPKLYPHYDDAFDKHKLTLDVQLYSTVSWPIVVEGDEFLLNNNEGVVFSGTDQIHWRSPLELSEDDVVDMVFCHCEKKPEFNDLITVEHRASMKEREMDWSKKIDVSREEVVINGQ